MKRRSTIKIEEDGPMDGTGYVYSPEDSDDDPRGDWQSRIVWGVMMLVGIGMVGLAIGLSRVE